MSQPEPVIAPRVAGSSVALLAGGVVGSAIASTHLRLARGQRLLEEAPVLFWLIFVFLSLVAAGPCVLLARWGRRWLQSRRSVWLAVALPWWAALPWAATQSSQPPRGGSAWGTYEGLLLAGAVAGALFLAGIAWGSRLALARGRHDLPDESDWTEAIGLALFGLWPIQLVMILVLVGP